MNNADYDKLRRILLDEYAMDRFFERLQKKDESKVTESIIDLLRGICRITIEQRSILTRAVNGIPSDTENVKRSDSESLKVVLNERVFKHDYQNILDVHKSIDDFADDLIARK